MRTSGTDEARASMPYYKLRMRGAHASRAQRASGRVPKTERRRMAEGTNVATITDDNFADEIEGGEGLSMVDFWAEWCGPCRMVGPVVNELADDFAGRVRVGKLNIDENQSTPVRFGVRSIPTILFFKGGELVDTVVGAAPKAHLEQKIEQHL